MIDTEMQSSSSTDLNNVRDPCVDYPVFVKPVTINPCRRITHGKYVKLKLTQPSIQYSGRTFIRRINDFVTFLELDEVLFPDLLRPETKRVLEETVRDAKSALESIKKQLYDISNFMNHGSAYEERMLACKRRKRHKDRLAKRASRERRRKLLLKQQDKNNIPIVLTDNEPLTAQREMPKLIQIVNCLKTNPIIESLNTLSGTLVCDGIYPSNQRIGLSTNITRTDIPQYEPISEAEEDPIIDVVTVDNEALDLSTKVNTQVIKSIRFV